jgi:hypothetical protein
MQTLGISESTPRSDGHLKSLFWPSIQSGADVDYLGAQGYWVCSIVAAFSFVVLMISGHPIVAGVVLLLYYLGGVGVRERSRYAAIVVFVLFVLDTFASGIGIIRILFGALLLSNCRATWIAANWRPESEEAALPPRLGDTWSDKFADTFPAWLWPKIRIFYYIFSIGVVVVLQLAMMLAILR